MPWIMTALGVSSAKDIIYDWQDNQKEILLFIHGSKEFIKIDPKAQFFLIAIIIFLIAVISFVVGYVLYEKWHCYEKFEIRRKP
jgi:hypothetical protein